MEIRADVVIVGTGVAGLFSALNLPSEKSIVMITKSDAESSDSFLAQGGICVLRDEADYEAYFEDTMRAGHYENRRESVEIMIRGSQDVIRDLEGYGVEFEKKHRPWGEYADGADRFRALPQSGGAARETAGDSRKWRKLDRGRSVWDSVGKEIPLSEKYEFTREGAHSQPRILFHEDVTGREITSKLLQRVRELDNVALYEYTTMKDLIVRGNRCHGIVAENRDGSRILIRAGDTILASGGIGGRYRHSTNFPHLTGDALELAERYGIRTEHLDYVQIHPTTLYSAREGRRFLISESVRGEGAVLLDKKGKRFVDELQPRDVVTKAIWKQMKKDQTEHVWLSMSPIEHTKIQKHFPNICQRCLEEGYDVTRDWIPVVPAQHYFMGGIWVDSDSRTSMHHLYAVGETSCNGVHGANRLASNSLLESLVFAKRAADHVSQLSIRYETEEKGK